MPASVSLAAPGDLDATFGLNGVTRTFVPGGSFTGFMHAVVVAPDGKIVTVGDGGYNVTGSDRFYYGVLARYLADGSPDPDFGVNGLVVTDLAGSSGEFTHVVIQTDGKLLVSGSTISALGHLEDMVLLRFDGSGRLDHTFGKNGVVTIVGSGSDICNSMVVQNDGKIVLTGGMGSKLAVLRLSAAGTLETKTLVQLATAAVANCIVQDKDGRFVVGGWSLQSLGSSYVFAMARFGPDLRLDQSFGDAGTLILAGLGRVSDVALQSDAGIIVAGQSMMKDSLVVVRLSSSGVRDLSFGNAGVFSYSGFGPSQSNNASSVLVQPDDKIVVTGVAGGNDVLARLNGNGTLDAGFAGAGIRTGDIFPGAGGSGAIVGASAVQPDGRIIVVGASNGGGPQGPHYFGVARYFGDPYTPRLQVKSTPGGVLSSGGSALEFGIHPVGGLSPQRSFSIRNTGWAPLHISGTTVDGPNANTWTANLPAMILASGASTEFSITFTPDSVGASIGTLHIASDDPDQPFNLPLAGAGEPSVAFQDSLTLVREEAGTVQIPIIRKGSTSGPASVWVNGFSGTAGGSDYTMTVNSLVSFADGQTLATVPVSIIPDKLAEANEDFTLTLSSQPGGVALGFPSSTTVRIIDSADTTKPTVVIDSPSAGANVMEGVSLNVTGTAADNKGVFKVLLSFNGAAFAEVHLTPNSSGTKATYSYPLGSLVPGSNVVQVKSIDTRNNESTVVTRSFNYSVIRPLTVSKTGSGSLTAPFPGTDATKKVGFPYTLKATPGVGQVFDGWTANDFTGTNTTLAMQELAMLTFTHQQGLELTAHFIPNPFIESIVGTYQGIAWPSVAVPDANGSKATNETVGAFSATVTSTGGFTGTLKIDGLALSVVGTFDNTGHARFGTTRAKSVTLARTGKPGLEVALNLDMSGSSHKLTGTLTQHYRGTVSAQSDIDCVRAFYSKTNKAPEALAGTASRAWTMLLRHETSIVGLTRADYPQGDGFATGTVKVDGSVTFAGKLADHTPFTTSALLSDANAATLFAPLYAGRGCFLNQVILTPTSATDGELAGFLEFWIRPYQAVQWYPWGWPDGIGLQVFGAIYQVPAQPLWSGLNPTNSVDGNVSVKFLDGQLGLPLIKAANFSAATAAKAPTTDASWSFSLAPSTGAMSGTFTHSNGTKPNWQGVLIQRGAFQGAWGYFMTTAPKVTDGLGESGRVEMSSK